VASFSLSAIRINESVALILQLCLGGQAINFSVQSLSGRCFRFEVCSKNVGFLIYGLKSYSCKSFMVHFSLWSNGGPNWKREFVIWMDLQEREWTTVHRKHSYASVVQNSVARNRPQNPTVFQRLQFPVDYQDNFRDEINRYTDHSKELLADLRPKTVFQRLAYPMALHQPRTSSGSVHPQARVHRNDSALNFKQGRNQGAHFKAADSINTSNLGRGFAAQGNQFNKERLNAQQFRPFKGKCYKCLGWGHTRRVCNNQIRCKSCHNYGHISRLCLSLQQKKYYHQKSPSVPEATLPSGSRSPGFKDACCTPSHQTPLSPHSPSTTAEHAAALAGMLNNPVDPNPLLSWGFVICNRSQEEGTPQRVYAFLGTSVSRINENVAIVVLDPTVDPVDYPHVANAIYGFLVNYLCLRGISISPSGLGAALVSFASALDRQTAMGPPHHVEPYWFSFIPHDSGPNLRHLPLDRTCWLMLINFPIDCLNEDSLATAVSSFANLIQWHRSSNLARQLVLVNIHSSARIPFSIVVTVGDEPYARCWSVAVFLLTETHMQLPIGTDALPPVGTSPHSLPLVPHRWMGNGTPPFPRRGLVHEHEGTGSWSKNRENPRNREGPVVNLPMATPPAGRSFVGHAPPPEMSAVNLNEVFAKFYRYSAYDSIAFGGLFSVLQNAVLGLSHLSAIECLNLVPGLSFFPQAIRVVSQNCALEELDAAARGTHESADGAEAELQVLQARPEVFLRRCCKAAVPVDTSLLCRSARLEMINKGFNPNMATPADPASSSTQISKSKGKKNKGKAVMSVDGPAYEGHSVPGVTPAPHLSVANVQAIGAGYCKMHPSVVSAMLHAPLNEDIDQ
jgi:hypothetical protein